MEKQVINQNCKVGLLESIWALKTKADQIRQANLEIGHELTRIGSSEDAFSVGRFTAGELFEALNQSDDLIFVKDVFGVYTFCNLAFAEFLQTTPDSILGKTDFDLLPLFEAMLLAAFDTDVMAHGLPKVSITNHDDKDGDTPVYETVKAPYLVDDAVIAGVIGISHEVNFSGN